jgi:hypothetical protein
MSNVGYVTAWAKTDLQPLIVEEDNNKIVNILQKEIGQKFNVRVAVVRKRDKDEKQVIYYNLLNINKL